MAHGVAIIGAGPGVRALHLPTLARLPEHFDVVTIADAGSGRAAALAAPLGIASGDVAQVMADVRAEVVAVCSPPEHHATHVIAAAHAGKRGILCEKPLATSIEDAQRAVDACRASGTALVVGTNHLFDPAWGRAKHHLDAHRAAVRSVSLVVSLPPNERYHRLVSEYADGTAAPSGPPDITRPEVARDVVRRLVEGLIVHDLPLLRDLAPGSPAVLDARAIPPVGCELIIQAGGVVLRVVAVLQSAGADALWQLTIATDRDVVDVRFPPSFVHDGSAQVAVRGPTGTVTTYSRDAMDGYELEWRSLAELLDGSPVELDPILDDARWTCALAEGAAAAAARSAAGAAS